MTKTLLGCALIALAAGCATSAPQKKVQVRVVEMNELKDAPSNPDKTYVCEEGSKTGSQLKGSICQSVSTREREHQAAQDAIHRMMMSGSDIRR